MDASWLDSLGSLFKNSGGNATAGLGKGLTGSLFKMPDGSLPNSTPVQMNPMSMGMGVIKPSDWGGAGASDGAREQSNPMAALGLLSHFMGGGKSSQQSPQPAPMPGGTFDDVNFMPTNQIATPVGTGGAASLLQQIMQRANSGVR